MLTSDHTVLPDTHTLIHELNEPPSLYSAAAEHHRTLTGTHCPSRQDRRLSRPFIVNALQNKIQIYCRRSCLPNALVTALWGLSAEMDMGWVNPWVGLGLGPNFAFCNGLGWVGLGPAKNDIAQAVNSILAEYGLEYGLGWVGSRQFNKSWVGLGEQIWTNVHLWLSEWAQCWNL